MSQSLYKIQKNVNLAANENPDLNFDISIGVYDV